MKSSLIQSKVFFEDQQNFDDQFLAINHSFLLFLLFIIFIPNFLLLHPLDLNHVVLCNFRTRVRQVLWLRVHEATLNGKVVLDQATQILHSTIDEIILGLECFLEIFEDRFNLACLFLPLIRHIARVELSKHIVFALHLFYLSFLRGNFRLGLSQLSLGRLKLILDCMQRTLHTFVHLSQCTTLLIVVYYLFVGLHDAFLELIGFFGGTGLELSQLFLQCLVLHGQVFTVFLILLIQSFMLLHFLATLSEVLQVLLFRRVGACDLLFKGVPARQ